MTIISNLGLSPISIFFFILATGAKNNSLLTIDSNYT